MKVLKILSLFFFLCGASLAQLTQVTGTIVDPNANPYASGTASAYQVVGNGQAASATTPVPTSSAGLFTLFLPAATYLFTVCAPPPLLNVPTTNPTPKQVCFSSGPIAISGSTQDVSTQLNAIAVVIGPKQNATGGGGGGGGGINIGNLTPGCIPVAAPAGSSTPLTCGPLSFNGQVLTGSAPLQIPSVTATNPNTGGDFTGGDCSNLTFQAQHSYLCADSAYNYALHYFVGGLDTGGALLQNPSGSTYHIDGFFIPGGANGICNFLQTLPAKTVATVYVDVLTTNENCDPFNQGDTIHLVLGAQNAPYTFNVPLRIGPNEHLTGSGRGFSGQNTRGTTIAPGSSYANPFISTTPSGFTFAAAGSGCTFPTGAYLAEVSWGPDATRETLPGQVDTVINITLGQCFQITPPVSPPAGVTTYDVYICQIAGCTSGQELWQAQNLIGVTTNFVGPFQTGNGRPVGYNNTGTFIVVGNANGPQGNAGSTQATFGARLEDVSIDCANVTGCVAAANLTGEEGAGIFRVDANNVAGVAEFIWEGYGNIGEAGDNSRMVDITANAGSTSNPSISAVILDQLTSVRGIDGFTITVPQTSGASSCILVNGTTVAPIGGTAILNGHMEKCGDGILLQNSAGAFISNMSCSPANISHCVHNATTGGNFVAVAIRGGNTDAPIFDEGFSPAFTDTKGFEPFYSNFGTSYVAQLVGSAPTCSALPVNPGPNLTGTTGTCVMDTGSNNLAGTMNFTAAGGSELTAGTVQLTFAQNGLGVNSSACTFIPVSAGTAWPDNTTWRGTAFGTGNVQVRFIPGGGTGTAFANGNTFKINYQCGAY